MYIYISLKLLVLIIEKKAAGAQKKKQQQLVTIKHIASSVCYMYVYNLLHYTTYKYK